MESIGVNSSKTNRTELVMKNGQTNQTIRETMPTERRMDMEFRIGLMALVTWVSGRIIKLRALENSNSLTAENRQETG